MEIYDLYTRERAKTDRTLERGVPCEEGFYRLVVHVCIFNSQHQMLIQKRTDEKEYWPGLWDVTVGGSAIAGDSSQTAAQRETQEELGLPLDFDHLRPTLTINFKEGFDDYYLLQQEVDLSSLTLQKEEVSAVKWASRQEVLDMIADGQFIGYSTNFIGLLFDLAFAEHGLYG